MGPGRGRERNRSWVVLGVTTVLPLAVILYVTSRVAGGREPQKGSIAPPGDHLDAAGHFFLGVAVVLVAAQLGGVLVERLGQPRVIGEILAGITLGPSLLGQLSPAASGWIFPSDVMPMLDGLGQLGLVLFVFGVGRELGALQLRGTGRRALLVSKASLLVPFAAGVAVAVPLTDVFMGDAGHPLAFVLFVGCALSVTAFPVLARILTDLRITQSEQGRLSLFAAAVGDAAVWLVLAAVLATAGGSSTSVVIRNAFSATALAVVFLWPLRIMLGRWRDRARDERPGPVAEGEAVPGASRKVSESTIMALLVAGIAATATLTASVGVHALIGALLVGVAWPKGHAQAARVADRLSGTAKSVLLPFFFFGFGLTLDQNSLPLDGTALLTFTILLALAVSTKISGPAIAARFTGLAWRPALALGVLLNTRGLTELVIIRIGYDAGIMDQRLLSILTLVTIVTTMMTRPLLHLVGVRVCTVPPSASALPEPALPEPVPVPKG